MTQHFSGLRVLICEDEYLLASDLAAELSDRGVTVAGIMARVSEVMAALEREDFNANAVALDVQLLDGMAFPLVEPMLAKGMSVVLCTGYGARDLPPEYANLPTVGKPTDIDRLLAAFTQGGLADKGIVGERSQ
jgi:ActR/RegA family two-component response regulator